MTRIFLLAGAAILSGCGFVPGPDVTRFMEPDVILTRDAAPASAAPGTCWAEIEPAPVLTSVTAQLLTQSVKRAERPDTVEDDATIWFERPCDAEMTAYFIESLQRALTVRGLYRREITGVMDPATRFAVRLYQQPLGLDSGVLSLSASRSLGLSRVAPDEGEMAAMQAEFPQDEDAIFIPETTLDQPEVKRPVIRP